MSEELAIFSTVCAIALYIFVVKPLWNSPKEDVEENK